MHPAVTHRLPLLPKLSEDITVLERGWLSSNNILLAAPGEPTVLVDSGHVRHAEQTVALVRHALAGRPLSLLLNTHLHSDHCGGNAALARAHGMPLHIPPGLAAAVQAWDEAALSYRASGQHIEPYAAQAQIEPGSTLRLAGRDWEVLAAPGHDPHSVMFFQRQSGVLLSADALWEHGFGVVFPELEGEPGFDDVGAVLEQIARLPVKCVVPGHGAPFVDVQAALQRAHHRLRGFKEDPARHARHAAKVLIKYHLMEERAMPWPALLQWAASTPLLRSMWQLYPPRGVAAIEDWARGLVTEMAQAGHLAADDARVEDR